ncbi:growth hormone receptor-like isoform X2 [Mobula birostris]|uniref:growth hormone receptor-like isoform X2 n=1 Tax=Mobula birostris TaxID=1983395 RepID=UPI003B28721B
MAAPWLIWYLLAVAFIDSAHSSDGPSITECRSPEQETFTCSWSAGSIQNLTEHGQLKFFYAEGDDPNWRECPKYIARENSCYFNQTHTSETEYCVQLKSGNITHDQRCFVLAEIVKPDAPISLNWSLLNISQSGLIMDIQLWWAVSVNADASSGRIPRKFGIHYKLSQAEHWSVIETLPGLRPPQPLYGLATGKEYAIRLKCSYHNVGNFSEFSDILYVYLPTPHSVEDPLERPSIIECRSPEQETFTCRWSSGTYQNLTEHRQLRFFYTKGNNADWKECPKYLHNKSSCYFNQTYTSIWVSYCVQLKSELQGQDITFDKRCFSIDNIEAGLLFRLILAFASLGIALIVFLFLYTKNQRLKLFFLPPVPVPKIKGIDSDLLKKGKMDEVNSIFANHLSYKSDVYIDDPWIEFIDTDFDDVDEKTEVLDTDRLLGSAHPKTDNCLNVKDDDSGRDSCYEPDVSEAEGAGCRPSANELTSFQLKASDEIEDAKDATGIPVGTSDADDQRSLQASDEECDCSQVQQGITASTKTEVTHPPVHSQLSNQSSFGKMDFYAQVSDITPAGGVLLSPGQQNKAEVAPTKETSAVPKASQKGTHPDSAYTSEGDMRQFCASSVSKENLLGTEKNLNQSNYFTTESLATTTIGSCKEAENARQPKLPVPDYTSIHMVDSQQSLLLNPNVLPSKSQPTLAGYLMPEQLGSVVP